MRIEVIRQSKIPEGWSSAAELEKVAEPGDIIEIKFARRKSHFLLNIRNGWCVHVRDMEGDERSKTQTGGYVVKDATDLQEEAGTRPCRINNFQEFAQTHQFPTRSLKECLTLSRAKLASGPTAVPLTEITPVFDNENWAQEFCFFWKYKTSSSSSPINALSLPYLLLVMLFAAITAVVLTIL